MTAAIVQLTRLVFDETPGAAPVPFDRDGLTWILDCGLGPLLWHLLERHPGLIPPGYADYVKAANLSAYVLSSETFDHLDEILDRAANVACQITLLKGVSVAQQWYPARHWRPMRDIDVLVNPRDQSRFEQQLVGLGYRQTSNYPPEFYLGHQHSMPFFHPTKKCWVEVHTALFPADTPAGQINVFKPSFLRRVPAQGVGHTAGNVWRLSDELQLIYAVVHWATQLRLVGGFVPVLDSLLILKNSRNGLDWDWILKACRNDTAARHLWLMFSYLATHGLYDIPSDVQRGLENGRRVIGSLGQRLLHRIIDQHMAARPRESLFNSDAMISMRWNTLLSDGAPMLKLVQLPWRIIFPPREKGRYRLARQWQRLKNALTRALR
jgi:hypothetical protein